MVEKTAPLQVHGGLDASELARLRLDPSNVLDFSVNVNPYGPSPAMTSAVSRAAIDRYPDPVAGPARRAIAGWVGVEAERVFVGNGAVDVLWLLARAFAGPDDPVLVVEPAFSEMRAAAARTGARVIELRTNPDDDFALDLEALDALVRETAPALAYVCTPANPSGRSISLVAIESLAARHPSTRFVVDVSFASMSTRHADAPRSKQVVWVRSLTKDHSLAGLRVGFAVAPPEVVQRLERERPPWSVNALAQAAAIAATTDAAVRFVDETRARLLADRAHLEDSLRALDLRVHPSDTIFCLVDLGRRVRASELRESLLARHGILVRDATSFGLPHHVRLAARPRPDVGRLAVALGKELGR
jgi:histidinol-phosphate/aromatic aminotransferase/cobyric acid decarboxylase-like protein